MKLKIFLNLILKMESELELKTWVLNYSYLPLEMIDMMIGYYIENITTVLSNENARKEIITEDKTGFFDGEDFVLHSIDDMPSRIVTIKRRRRGVYYPIKIISEWHTRGQLNRSKKPAVITVIYTNSLKIEDFYEKGKFLVSKEINLLKMV